MSACVRRRIPLAPIRQLSALLGLLSLILAALPAWAQKAPAAPPDTVPTQRETAEALQAPADPAGAWEGSITVPTGPLNVRVELSQGEEGWTGTIDIPQQGAQGLALEPVAVEGDSVRFSIRGVPGDPTFDGTLDGDSISGRFTQGPAQLSFSLTRTDRPAPELRRPQTPKPPFPYRSEEVEVPSGDPEDGGVTLAGTLTLPEGEGPFPGIVLLTGSGPQDRDETLFGHKPFLVIADYLTRHGVAVLRLDDRGVGGSTGSLATTSLEDLARDARAAVRFLASRTEVAGDRVGLLGHSEGGVVAPLAAIQETTREGDPAPAFLVLLAGPGIPGRELLQEQLGGLGRRQGVPESLGDVFDAMIAAGIDSMLEGTTEDALREHLTEMATAQTEELSSGEQTIAKNVAGGLATQLNALQARLLRDFLLHDPRPVLRKIRIPVLALNGARDLQVDPERNLTAIGEALEAAGNEEVTLRTLPDLNHLFQETTTGNTTEYGQLEQTIDPEVLDLIESWIVERFGPTNGS